MPTRKLITVCLIDVDGQKSISFYTESGNQIFLRGYVKNEDTDMIRLFTNMDTLVQLTERLPTSMDMQDSEAEAHSYYFDCLCYTQHGYVNIE